MLELVQGTFNFVINVVMIAFGIFGPTVVPGSMLDRSIDTCSMSIVEASNGFDRFVELAQLSNLRNLSLEKNNRTRLFEGSLVVEIVS